MEEDRMKKEQLFLEIENLVETVHTILSRDYRIADWGNELTTNQQLLIFLVGKQNVKNVKALAQELSVSPSAVSQMVAKLEKMKIVKRSIDLENRRNICVELDKEGITILESLEKIRSEIISKYFSKIDLDDLQQFKKLYEKFYQIILQQEEGS